MTPITTIPPEPLGCREWRAYRDPEGLCGFGSTEQAAIADLRDLEAEGDAAIETREGVKLDPRAAWPFPGDAS